MLGKSTALLLELAIEQETKNAVEQHGEFWHKSMYRDALEEELDEVIEAYGELIGVSATLVATDDVYMIEKRIELTRLAKHLQEESTQVLAVLKKYDDFLEQYRKFERVSNKV